MKDIVLKSIVQHTGLHQRSYHIFKYQQTEMRQSQSELSMQWHKCNFNMPR